MIRRTRTMLRAAVLATALVPRAVFAYGADYYFVGPSGSLYSDPANWSTSPDGPGGTLPGDGDRASVFPTGALTLTLDAAPVDTSASSYATLQRASFVGPSAAAPLTVNVTLADSDVYLDTTRSFYLNSVSVGPNVTANHTVGRITATMGEASVSGPNTTYNLSGSAYLSGSGGVSVVGATVFQSGGTVRSDNAVRISGSSYSLSGGGIGGDDVLVDSSLPTTFTQTGGGVGGYYSTVVRRNTSYTLSAGSVASSNYIQIGDKPYYDTGSFPDAGTTFSQTGGSVRLNGDGAVVVNATPGSTALYAMSGGTLSASGSSHIYVGKTTSGTLAQTGGSAGAMGIWIGYQAGSTGTYLLGGDAQASAAHMQVGYNGSGSLALTDSATVTLTFGFTVAAGPNSTGTVTQTGGVIRPTTFANNSVPPCTFTLAAGTGSSASYTLTAGVLNVSTVSGVANYVARAGSATFDQTGGTLDSFATPVVLASEAGSSGTYRLSGAGSLSTVSTTVADAGRGYLLQTGGTHITTSLTIAAQPGSAGIYDLLGGSLAANTVTNNGTFYMRPAASFTLTGTTFTNNGSATFDGTQSWPAGATFANTLVAYFRSDPGSAGSATLNVTSASPDWAPVVFDAPAVHLASLVLSGATHATVPASAAGTLLSTRSLSITDTARLDLADNTLLVDYTAGGAATPADEVRGSLLAGRIASSLGDAGRRLGYIDSGAAVIVRLTLAGDANLDGVPDADDYALLDRGFAAHASTWQQGDFDYDGQVTSADFLLIDVAYGRRAGAFSPQFLGLRESQFGAGYVAELVAGVPEPSAVMGAAGVLLVRRRRVTARRGRARGSRPPSAKEGCRGLEG